MKKLFLLGLLFPLAAVSHSQEPEAKKFQVIGSMKNLPDSLGVEWVYLMYRVNGESVTDSVQPAEGRYRFEGSIPEPVLARISVKFAEQNGRRPVVLGRRDMTFFFLEPGKQKARSTDSISNLVVKGSRAQSDYKALLARAKPYNDRYQALIPEYTNFRKEKNTAEMERVEAELDRIDAERRENVYAAWVREKPGSPIVIYALQQYAGWDIDPDKVEPLYNMVGKKARQYPSAITLAENLEIAKKTGIGRIAMDFTQNDTLGLPVSLSSFRGKFVLVDFWASWCGPCRAENPNVVSVFNKYKDKNFHIIGVSLDRPGQKEKWLKAIHDDGLAWTQLSDLLFWENAVAKQYGIRAIPQNLLIDPEGKIIGKNLRGEALGKKVEEAITARKGF